MLGIVGTVPDPDFPLVHGPVAWDDDRLTIAGRRVAVLRGTPALLAAALTAAPCLGRPEIYAFLAGDIGKGQGSRQLYQFLEKNLKAFDLQVLTFHYLQPDVDWHNRVLFAIDAMPRRPLLIADAGFMYAAKMSGQAAAYDFFTPDAGELAFLADETAPHPFYTRGFILHQDNDIPQLIRRAYRHGNAARHLVVKGATDHIANEEGILFRVDQPSFDAMEAIGGTGDTLTGLLTVLCGAGFGLPQAGLLAARANRLCGSFVTPTPATQVATLIEAIPQALADVLERSPRAGEAKSGEFRKIT
jgi:NAD(P)H-hydrate repair Nnr-like enzyme with NAD(P)H-hydrate dehydratase domain